MAKISVATLFVALDLVATTLGSGVGGEEPLFEGNGAPSFQRTLLSSRNEVLKETCNAAPLNWIGGDKFQQPLIVSSPGECCEKCQQIDDCVSWLWRGCCDNCWIKNKLVDGVPCDDGDCVGGIVDGGAALVELKDEQLRYNQTESNCERSGKIAATGAAHLGCKKVMKECKKPKQKDRKKLPDLAGDVEVLGSVSEVNGTAVSEKKCAKISRKACSDHAKDSELQWPAVADPECKALLMAGPASGSKGCKDQKEAQALFEKIVGAECEKMLF